jgi:arylsulfatase A-like enzyme
MNDSKNVERPNLVYVFADQLRYQSCGYAGDSKARTPNIDHLAAQGVNFVNAVSVSPTCAPYRASLFTGKYTSSTGMVINEIRMRPDPDAIGHVLKANGYRTGYMGKWHLYGTKNYPADEYQFVPPGPHRLGFDYWGAHNFNHNYYKAYYYRDDPKQIMVDGYEPDEQTNMAIEYMRQARDAKQPFALFLSYGTPHDPWNWDNCPEEYNKLFRDVDFPDPPNYRDGSAEYWNPRMTADWWIKEYKHRFPLHRKVYYAMTANLDWNMGRLVSAMDEMGLSESTILVFTSDHGEMSGAHGRIAKGIFYEEAARVPFLMRCPGWIPAGHVSDVCLNTPDIMPTLLSMMGLPIPICVEGQDLHYAAFGQPGLEPDAAFLQGMGHTYQWLDGFEWRALRDKRYTYAVMRQDGTEYLFDNQRDPYQMRNLVEEKTYAEVLDSFRDNLAKRMTSLNDTFESCTWYRDHWTEDNVILRSATSGTYEQENHGGTEARKA